MIILFLRSLAFNTAFFGWTAFIVIRAMPGFFMGRGPILRAANLWGRGVNWLLKTLCHIHVEIRGREHLPKDRPVIVAAKHQSTWETTNIEYLVPDCAIILKRELTFIPFFGQLLLKSGMISVHRQKGQSILPQIVDGARRCQKEGRSLLIFPEGTRRPPDAPPRYRQGIFPIYRALNVPVIPVAHNAGYFWGRRQFLKRPGTIVLEFLPAIEAGLEDKIFFATLEQRIEDACARLKPPTVAKDRHQQKPRHFWVRSLVILGLVGVFYGLAWYAAARYIAHHAASAVAAMKGRGFSVTLEQSTPTIGGFPGAVHLHWGRGRLSVMEKTLEGVHIISVHGLYPLNRVSIHITDGTVNNGLVPWGTAALLKATLRAIPKDASGMERYGLNVMVHHMVTPIPVLDRIEKAHLDMTWPVDIIPPMDQEKAKQFYDRGGTLEVHDLSIVTDTASVRGDGTLALDEDLQPMAAFGVDVTHVDKILKNLEAKKWISAKEAALIGLPLAFFKTNDDGRHRLPITLQDRQLSLGPVPLMTMPPVTWPSSRETVE